MKGGVWLTGCRHLDFSGARRRPGSNLNTYGLIDAEASSREVCEQVGLLHYQLITSVKSVSQSMSPRTASQRVAD